MLRSASRAPGIRKKSPAHRYRRRLALGDETGAITPAATCSIATGCYPIHTGIGGASWYERSCDDLHYYVDDFWVIAREGFGTFLRDFLEQLNGDRLRVPICG